MENYEIIKEDIGQGSFGKVCLVRHIQSGKQMVWKKINYGIMKDKEKKQLINEVNILRELKHDHIVRYHDKIIDKKNTTIIIIMEYCAGGDLSKLIKQCEAGNKFVPEEQIWKIFMQITLALFECHRRQDNKMILHRDLKPSNIFLDERQQAKLGDFGFAKAMNAQSVYAHTYLGTPFYMSPEQINESEYNEKSDIWSLGCIVYEMAALRPPFQAENSLSLALKIKSGQFNKLPTRYSEELNRSIRWMLNVDPKKRPNVEDLLNLPAISMLLREKALQKNQISVQRKAEEVKKKQQKLKEKEDELNEREKALKEKEREIEELERQLQEIQRLKKYSGSSKTTQGTDLGNESCINNQNQSMDRNFFTSPSNNNNELQDSVTTIQNNQNDLSREDSIHKLMIPSENSQKMFDTTQINQALSRQKQNIHGNGSQPEIASGEFRNGNLSGLLRDSSGSQFKSLTRALNRNSSNAQSKENLVDISTTSSNDKLAFNKGMLLKQKQLQQQYQQQQMQIKQQIRDGSNTQGHYRSVGNSQNLQIQTEDPDDQDSNQFQIHQKNKNLHDKIAINLPKNLNVDKENISRTANQNQLTHMRSSNDSIQLKRSYENMSINDSTVNMNPCTESQNSNSYTQTYQNTSSNNLATMSTNSQTGLPPTVPHNLGRMNSERISQQVSQLQQQQFIQNQPNTDQQQQQQQLLKQNFIKFHSKKSQDQNSYNSTMKNIQVRDSYEKNVNSTLNNNTSSNNQSNPTLQNFKQYTSTNNSQDRALNQIIEQQKQQQLQRKGKSNRDASLEISSRQGTSKQTSASRQNAVSNQMSQEQIQYQQAQQYQLQQQIFKQKQMTLQQQQQMLLQKKQNSNVTNSIDFQEFLNNQQFYEQNMRQEQKQSQSKQQQIQSKYY
ncbi:serine threonine-protein kinase nek2 [Stylonychia lemnae]|uniref:non-specific serine/threonine protein kinase n=1 Tax=Stylonychia lemnae TaxID=5949 RepID=A0A078AX26_STYLE|nr:serine threonine-protein kinase nek2 [Stylonychia lemnae]|eukprot:CDW86995.1 serine threonine-protein kinase nek2 [Stylonychia lemnae]